MRRMLIATAAMLVGALAAPVSAYQGLDTPYGREDNALGTLRWLPDNANEKPAVANQFRLVVAYDTSLSDTGASIPLKAKGAFGLKFFTTSQVDFKMKGHSPQVGDLNTLSGQSLPAQANETAAGVFGDVRDGACSKLGTPAFSAAYSTTRSFFHPGQTPYAAISAPGTCERVDQSSPINDINGNLLGYSTTVTAFVPGFYIDVEWLARATPPVISTAGSGRIAAEVWYGAAYDSAGDPGPFPNGVDSPGASKSVFGPGNFTYQLSFTANPGAIGDGCPGDLQSSSGTPAAPGSQQDLKFQVPEGAKKVTVKLWPKGDWDLRVIDPSGRNGDSGFVGGWEETEVIPTSGAGNIPSVIAGEWTMRGCNYSGETTVTGAVLIEM